MAKLTKIGETRAITPPLKKIEAVNARNTGVVFWGIYPEASTTKVRVPEIIVKELILLSGLFLFGPSEEKSHFVKNYNTIFCVMEKYV